MTSNGMELSWRWYLQYLKNWANDHKGMEFFGKSPACYQEWLDNEMAEQEGGDDGWLTPTLEWRCKMESVNKYYAEGRVIEKITDGFVLELVREVKFCGYIAEEKTVIDCKLSAFGGPRVGDFVSVEGRLAIKYWNEDDKELSKLYVDCNAVEVLVKSREV